MQSSSCFNSSRVIRPSPSTSKTAKAEKHTSRCRYTWTPGLEVLKWPSLAINVSIFFHVFIPTSGSPNHQSGIWWYLYMEKSWVHHSTSTTFWWVHHASAALQALIGNKNCYGPWKVNLHEPLNLDASTMNMTSDFEDWSKLGIQVSNNLQNLAEKYQAKWPTSVVCAACRSRNLTHIDTQRFQPCYHVVGKLFVLIS